MHADLLAATAPSVADQASNIACEQCHTLLDLIAIFNNILSTQIVPVCIAPHPGDVRRSLADIAATQEALGYRAEVDFCEEL